VPSELQQTDGDSVKRLSTDQIRLLVPAQTCVFDPRHLAALDENIEHLGPAALGALPAACLKELTEPQARKLRDVQFAEIPPDRLTSLLARFHLLQDGCFALLTVPQAGAFTAPLMTKLQRGQLIAIRPEVIG